MNAKDTTFLPWILAEKKGFFKEVGLDVAMPIMTAQVAVPALMSKQIDFAIGGSSARAAYQGAPIRVLMYALDGYAFLGITPKSIKTYKDLSGKVLATSSIGGSDDLITRKLMEREKVTGYQILPLGPPTVRAGALESGQVSFTLQDPMNGYRLERAGFRVLGSVDGIYPLPSTGFAAHVDTIAQKPDLVRAWLRATLKALLYEKQHPSETAEFVSAEFGVDRDIARKAVEFTVKYIDENDPGGVPEETLVNATRADFAQIKSSGDPVAMARTVHDFTLLRQVQREMGIKCKTGFQCE